MNTYTIFQVKNGDEYRGTRFANLEDLKRENQSLDSNNYDILYRGLIPNDTNINRILSTIYDKFNFDHPEDFTGHSLSVSDVVTLDINDKVSSYYVNSVGFEDVTQNFDLKNFKNFDDIKLNKIDQMNIKLFDKLDNEFTNFLEELKQLPPDKILDKCYEKVMKEDILLLFEERDLTFKEAKALFELEKPLDTLYDEWLGTDDSYLDMLRDSVDKCIVNSIKFMESKTKGVER